MGGTNIFCKHRQSKGQHYLCNFYFWIRVNDFFDIFGIHHRRVAIFERPVCTDDKGVKSIDLLWAGVLLVETKSTGQNLENE
ncbi:MAG: hypothetical protein FE834_02255 [Gammaproteobacteria bacterium]|nr:hypothetical protein [Gammaproteobacteria bacterium]